MNYHLQTRGYSEKTATLTAADKPLKTLGAAIEKILDILEYQSDDIAEVLICNDLGSAVYSVKPTGNRQFHLKELF